MSKDLMLEKLNKIKDLYTPGDKLSERFHLFTMGASDEELFRINCYLLADQMGVDRNALLIHFLHAVKVGFFKIHWDIHCPFCDTVGLAYTRLNDLNSQTFCPLCEIPYDITIDKNVQVTFTIDENIKRIDLPLVYEIPEQIELMLDYTLKPEEVRKELIHFDEGIYSIICPTTFDRGLINVDGNLNDEIQKSDIKITTESFRPDYLSFQPGVYKSLILFSFSNIRSLDILSPEKKESTKLFNLNKYVYSNND